MNRLVTFLLPLVLFLALCVFLFKGLYSDPTQRKSEVLAKPFPVFELPDLDNSSRMYTNHIFAQEVTLVNVWGVWCVTCAIELPYLTALSDQGLRIVGLYYDQDIDPDFGSKTVNRVREEVKQMTNRYGNPFAFNIFDVYRNTSLDLGVTGAPETFLVDQQGVIRVHHLGDINPRVWRNKFAPVLAQLDAKTQQQIEDYNTRLDIQNTPKAEPASQGESNE